MENKPFLDDVPELLGASGPYKKEKQEFPFSSLLLPPSLLQVQLVPVPTPLQLHTKMGRRKKYSFWGEGEGCGVALERGNCCKKTPHVLGESNSHFKKVFSLVPFFSFSPQDKKALHTCPPTGPELPPGLAKKQI